jgi:hypothetical protein
MEKIDIQGLKAKYKANQLKGLKAIAWETLSYIHLETARDLVKEGMNWGLQSAEIKKAEDRLNEVWRLCLKGELALDDFKAVNQQWGDSIRAANAKNQESEKTRVIVFSDNLNLKEGVI